ncbi:MAG TPA: thioesterase domain-containing protein [Nocardioides sp.]|uniref:thioesterase domain-containing protein n=1 Tax=Nocardioides sp. TaxID=35761 RepID=UPI002E359EF1|nr:thioesterase domain-containing protein [Nocardioides sp.]HEX5089007.1 thioesterase domain-containing protein [Nocardioides sp.]
MCRLTAEELRPGSDDILFVLGGAGGATDELGLVAAGLTGDPRVVALAVAAEPGEADTIESMAAATVEVIRAEQPSGPYRLLGYSFGGLLALEAGRLLTDAGEAVTFVGLMDSLFDQRYWPTALFVKATVSRARLHARGLVGKPPTVAIRELAGRSARLATRLRGRQGAANADPGGAAGGAATVQDANLAVMATWRPRVLDLPVTLFAATESDFGCDLAELWRPWLTRLDVHRVEGNHLDLTQTAAGAARLARAVSGALEVPAPRLRVLVATTFRWPGAARLAVDLHEVGCTVEGVAPRGSTLHALAAVQRTYRLGLADPVRSLRNAVEASDADLVIPVDDRTRHALGLLHASSDPGTRSGARMRERLERSLGSPDKVGGVYARASVLAMARDAGVLCPETETVRSANDIAAWFGRHPGPAVLKTDGSWGGRGVAVLYDEADGRRAWRELRRRLPLARALKRLVVERDPWPLRDRLAGTRPTLSIQAYVAGRPANAAVACFRGAALGAVQAVVVESDGPTGPSTVVRVVDNPDMAYAVKSIVSNLELSGLCGLDFILDDEGRAHLLELNPRATPTSHLLAADGTDLLTELRTAFGFERPAARSATYAGGLVALFPQELRRDPSSPYLRLAHHDVPTHAPDLVAHVLSGRRTGRRMVARPEAEPASS